METYVAIGAFALLALWTRHVFPPSKAGDPAPEKELGQNLKKIIVDSVKEANKTPGE